MNSYKQQVINGFKQYSSRRNTSEKVCYPALHEKLAFDVTWHIRYYTAQNLNTLISTLEKLENNKRDLGVTGAAYRTINTLKRLKND